ncbi:uncharacterized protein LOC123267024 [Cotesia glomerata]|uniref:Secreted protein n=1 Tax=Cotesia glomerata TaxID=32391 RepID=A0AAV7HW22_COTGL|nr:uncharacterized protein LOC123267024 [Cotesia glomerata]KAH0534677.1 hypothetical protein KQX54_006609 [Cotesia glomerata]
MFVPTFAVIFTLAIYQVASAPVDGRVESDGSYKRLYLPYIQSVAKDGTKTILTSEDLLNLSQKLKSGEIPSTTLHQLIGINGFSHTLSDHQLQRIADHDIAAIVSPQSFNQPGFGHLFITIDNNGIVQTFIYNVTMQEAMEKVEKEGYPNSSSSGSYHHN